MGDEVPVVFFSCTSGLLKLPVRSKGLKLVRCCCGKADGTGVREWSRE